MARARAPELSLEFGDAACTLRPVSSKWRMARHFASKTHPAGSSTRGIGRAIAGRVSQLSEIVKDPGLGLDDPSKVFRAIPSHCYRSRCRAGVQDLTISISDNASPSTIDVSTIPLISYTLAVSRGLRTSNSPTTRGSPPLRACGIFAITLPA
jgi:hypothetical protein